MHSLTILQGRGGGALMLVKLVCPLFFVHPTRAIKKNTWLASHSHKFSEAGGRGFFLIFTRFLIF